MALLLSLDCSTFPLIRTLYCWMLSKEVSSTILKSFVWRDLGLNPALQDHLWTLYPLGQWVGFGEHTDRVQKLSISFSEYFSFGRSMHKYFSRNPGPIYSKKQSGNRLLLVHEWYIYIYIYIYIYMKNLTNRLLAIINLFQRPGL